MLHRAPRVLAALDTETGGAVATRFASRPALENAVGKAAPVIGAALVLGALSGTSRVAPRVDHLLLEGTFAV